MLPSPFPSDGFVFVVTYGRSGSTLLQSVLNALPGTCIRGENENVLAQMAAAYHRLADSPNIRLRRERGDTGDEADPWAGAERIRPDAFGAALADLFVRDILNLPPDTRIGGFKEIRYTMPREPMFRLLDFMHRFFPRARFVFNTRDIGAVLRSGWWRDQDPAAARALLERADANYAAYLAKHPGRGILLRYEDYVRDPVALRPMFDLVEAPWDAALVERILARRLTHSGMPPQPRAAS